MKQHLNLICTICVHVCECVCALHVVENTYCVCDMKTKQGEQQYPAKQPLYSDNITEIAKLLGQDREKPLTPSRGRI